MRFHRIAALLLALAFVTGCAATKLAPSDIRMLPYYSLDPTEWPDNERVPGLDQAIAAAPADRPVKLLTIHGMVVSNSGFSKEWQEKIVEQLKLVPDSHDPVPINLFRGYDIELVYGPQPLGSVASEMTSRLTRTVWRDKPGGVAKLIVYELFWAPIRDDLKYRFLGCFESRSEPGDRAQAEVKWKCPNIAAARNNGSQAWINGALKDGLMVRGFADAVIANGAMGDVLRDDLSLATCVMAFDTLSFRQDVKLSSTASPSAAVMQRYEKSRCEPDALGETNAELRDYSKKNLEYFVLTHSLGSYFFFESQMRHEFVDPKANSDFIQFQMFDDANIFMFANQISLLSLANVRGICWLTDQPGPAPPKCPNFRLPTVDEWESRAGGHLTTYVAFNDADDVLGFELPPFLSDVGLGRFINVTVHNPAFSLPFIVRNPAEVHTSQERNPAVIDAIVNGIDIPEPPRRQPSTPAR